MHLLYIACKPNHHASQDLHETPQGPPRLAKFTLSRPPPPPPIPLRSPACTYLPLGRIDGDTQTRATRASTPDTTSSILLRGTASAPPTRQTGSTWAWACVVMEIPTPRSSGTAPTLRSRLVSERPPQARPAVEARIPRRHFSDPDHC